MNRTNAATAKKVNPIAIVDAPNVSLAEGEQPGDLLLHFYRALGWNGDDFVDPCKVRTTQGVYNGLLNQIHENFPDIVQVGMFMVNAGPGVDDHIPQNKVYLLEGWVSPCAA